MVESLLEISISAESHFFCRHVTINIVKIHTSYEEKRPKNIDFSSVVAFNKIAVDSLRSSKLAHVGEPEAGLLPHGQNLRAFSRNIPLKRGLTI
jgi:hypothetical protein